MLDLAENARQFSTDQIEQMTNLELLEAIWSFESTYKEAQDDHVHEDEIASLAERIQSLERCKSLLAFRFRSILKSERGRHGEGSNRTGRGGKDLIVPVPLHVIRHPRRPVRPPGRSG